MPDDKVDDKMAVGIVENMIRLLDDLSETEFLTKTDHEVMAMQRNCMVGLLDYLKARTKENLN